MSGLRDIFGALVREKAWFVVVGGAAMRLHGSTYVTQDVDIVYERSRENAQRIVAALGPFRPRPREFPADLPFIFDVQTLLVADILTLESDAGDIDLLATLKGVGNYPTIEAASEWFSLDDLAFQVLSIDGLIAAKTASGRPKDKAGVVELRALKEITEKRL
ncbi:MAG: hypothetical protein ACREMT_07160 [Vulcanimicrobiaceae bacterium]